MEERKKAWLCEEVVNAKAQLGASVLGGGWGEPSLQGGKRGWLLWVLFVKRSGGVCGFDFGGSDCS